MKNVLSSPRAGSRQRGDVKTLSLVAGRHSRHDLPGEPGRKLSWSGLRAGSVGGDVAANWKRFDDRGELLERVVDECLVDVDHLEAQPGGRVVGEEAIERAASFLELMVRPNSSPDSWSGFPSVASPSWVCSSARS
jgi:hypothetical protein